MARDILVDLDIQNIEFDMTRTSHNSNNDIILHLSDTFIVETSVFFLNTINNYVFSELPKLSVTVDGVTNEYNFTYGVYNNATGYFFIYRSKSEADKTVTAKITARAVEYQSDLNEYKTTGFYKVDSNIMNSLVSQRFWLNSTDNNYYDYGKYIVSLRKYPFKLVTDLNSNIILGVKDTQINANLVKNQYYTVESETVRIEGLRKNDSDINSIDSIKVILPYVNGIKELGKELINTEIKFRYKCDVVNNTCKCYVFSNDIIVEIFDCQLGFNIPFITYDNNLLDSFNYRELPSFIEEIKIIVTEKNISKQLKNSKERNKINNMLGYGFCTFDNIYFELTQNSKIVKREYDEIKNLLRQGIIL